jgi:adenylate kinase family enzyme
LASALAARLGCPHIELDAIFHQPGWTELEDEEFVRRVREATEPPRWVVDGNYSIVHDTVWSRADTVAWFDLPLPIVMFRVIRRTLGRVFRRTELWNGNKEPWSNLWSLDPDTSIIAWAATQHRRYRERYAAAEVDPRWSALTFVRLRSQHDVDRLMERAVTMAPEGGAT